MARNNAFRALLDALFHGQQVNQPADIDGADPDDDTVPDLNVKPGTDDKDQRDVDTDILGSSPD